MLRSVSVQELNSQSARNMQGESRTLYVPQICNIKKQQSSRYARHALNNIHPSGKEKTIGTK
jgi:hypothetical protein